MAGGQRRGAVCGRSVPAMLPSVLLRRPLAAAARLALPLARQQVVAGARGGGDAVRRGLALSGHRVSPAWGQALPRVVWGPLGAVPASRDRSG